VKPAERKAQAKKVLAGLRKMYPEAHCELDFKSPLELVAATILSAQCTDKRVNMVTPELFRRFGTVEALAKADVKDIETIIRSTGFYRAKAASLKAMAQTLVAKFGGKVPRTMDELLTLRGVARKTANVVLGTAYGVAVGVVVDTHMKRVSYRLGLTDHQEPVKVEADLMECVPQKDWIYFGHAMIWHGRRVCFAVKPNCPGCPLKAFCPKRGVTVTA